MSDVLLSPRHSRQEVLAACRGAGYAQLELGSSGDDAVLLCNPRGVLSVVPDPASRGIRLVVAEMADLPASIAPICAAEARELMRAPSAQDRLLGVQAAAFLAARELAWEVALRLADTEPAVADLAAQVLQQVLPDVPPRGVLPLYRRAALLQAIRRDEADGEGLARLIASADWEVAVTAMLAADRQGFALPPDVRARVRLPNGRADGVRAEERHLLERIRERDAGDAEAGLPDVLAVFLASLSEPIPPSSAPPEAPGVYHGPDGPVLEDGAALIWVPPGDYWLGDAVAAPGGAAMPRRVSFPEGAYLDAVPRGKGTLAMAERVAAALARGLGRSVVLPPGDVWERAARGPDGRRFVGGAHRGFGGLAECSSLGLHIAGREWLARDEAARCPLTAAGTAGWPLAARTPADCADRHSYRFCYPL